MILLWYDNFIRFIGVTFPIRNRFWPERKIWWYLIPVILLDWTINIPEIHSTIAHLGELKVIKKWLSLLKSYFCSYSVTWRKITWRTFYTKNLTWKVWRRKVQKNIFSLKQLSWYGSWHRFSTVWQSTVIPWAVLLVFNVTIFIVLLKKRPSSLTPRPTTTSSFMRSRSLLT